MTLLDLTPRVAVSDRLATLPVVIIGAGGTDPAVPETIDSEQAEQRTVRAARCRGSSGVTVGASWRRSVIAMWRYRASGAS